MSATKELQKLGPISNLKPDLMQAYGAFDAAAMADGALDRKTKELIVIAIALTTQCPYCLKIHSDFARQAGATDEELAEVTFVAMTTRAGGALMHSANICTFQSSNGGSPGGV